MKDSDLKKSNRLFKKMVNAAYQVLGEVVNILKAMLMIC